MQEVTASEQSTTSAQDPKIHRFCEKKWFHVWNLLSRSCLKVLQFTARLSAQHPYRILIIVPLISLCMLLCGFLTNFYMESDKELLWTPYNSRSLNHRHWIETGSGFPKGNYPVYVLVHANGENVLSHEGVLHAMRALDAFKNNNTNYDRLCGDTYFSKISGCTVHGVTNFFHDSLAFFNESVHDDNETIAAISQLTLADGRFFDRKTFFGYAVPADYGLLKSIETYKMRIGLPLSEISQVAEKDGVNNILVMKNNWKQQNSKFNVEILSYRSYSDELNRAVQNDVPLIPIVFIVMALFCCMVYYKRDRVRSSSLLLGLGAVVTVLLSLATGYGLLFIVGVPFTNLTQIFPYIMLGVGIDDAFILTACFDRTNPLLPTPKRIEETIKDCGVSISATTFTTAAAFVVGISSQIPAVRNFYLYAFPCILIDFLYQVTFYIALMTINERRIQSNGSDWFFCRMSSNRSDSDEVEQPASIRIMSFYNRFLQCGILRWVIIALFIGFTAYCSYSASLLRQAFVITDMVPSNSYVKSFASAVELYTENDPFSITVYFRGVDFSSSIVQQQMEKYVEELSALPSVSNQPIRFWLRDFTSFVSSTNTIENDKSFEAQVDVFLSNPVYKMLYSNQIVRNWKGVVTACSVKLVVDLPLNDAKSQIKFLKSEYNITASQEINKENGEWPFFTYSESYYLWEFYAECVKEIMQSTIIGIVAVTVTTLFAIPHPFGIALIVIIIAMIYVDVLGTLQAVGFSINPVTYVGLVMSIGLMVDYVIHVVLKYFETKHISDRTGKVKHVLETIGASILIGGSSTVIGVIPLAFSTSKIFLTLFGAFFSFVVLALVHGLVLTPVLLVMFGPETFSGTVEEEQSSHVYSEDDNVRKRTASTEVVNIDEDDF